ncbi:hypothetical protein ACPOL_5272 [Acidisarcina polymorpha]|uniref:Uncharacterized protein n=1 Tax=Acidisarcina polymorpha TaxID=2211140 RepID=A0A2Z5G747_9BACT|nr:hypothetical protein ACPOL_5272 [Acidisarcina polymorpha]
MLANRGKFRSGFWLSGAQNFPPPNNSIESRGCAFFTGGLKGIQE